MTRFQFLRFGLTYCAQSFNYWLRHKEALQWVYKRSPYTLEETIIRYAIEDIIEQKYKHLVFQLPPWGPPLGYTLRRTA